MLWIMLLHVNWPAEMFCRGRSQCEVSFGGEGVRVAWSGNRHISARATSLPLLLPCVNNPCTHVEPINGLSNHNLHHQISMKWHG